MNKVFVYLVILGMLAAILAIFFIRTLGPSGETPNVPQQEVQGHSTGGVVQLEVAANSGQVQLEVVENG